MDIAPKFLEHIQKTCREAGLQERHPRAVQPGLGGAAAELGRLWCSSATRTTTSSSRSETMAVAPPGVRPGGRLVLIDFHRIPGRVPDWILNHVRAGQEVVVKEIAEAGFEKTRR